MIFISNEIFFDIWAAWLYCTTLYRRGSCFSITCPSPFLSSLVIVKVSVGSCSTQMVSSGQIFYCLSVVLTITCSLSKRFSYCTTLYWSCSVHSVTFPSPSIGCRVELELCHCSCSTQVISSGQIFYCLSVVLTITLSWDLRDVLRFTVFITTSISPSCFTRIIWITNFSIFTIEDSVSTSSNFVIFTLFFCRPGSILTI